MKIRRRVSIDVSIDEILYLLGEKGAPQAGKNVRATVEGDGQVAEVTGDNPLVITWDDEVEL